MESRLNKTPILLHDGRVVIRAFEDRLTATIHGEEEVVEKKFEHSTDLYSLPLKGLMNLALEFYKELGSYDA